MYLILRTQLIPKGLLNKFPSLFETGDRKFFCIILLFLFDNQSPFSKFLYIQIIPSEVSIHSIASEWLAHLDLQKVMISLFWRSRIWGEISDFHLFRVFSGKSLIFYLYTCLNQNPTKSVIGCWGPLTGSWYIGHGFDSGWGSSSPKLDPNWLSFSQKGKHSISPYLKMRCSWRFRNTVSSESVFLKNPEWLQFILIFRWGVL